MGIQRGQGEEGNFSPLPTPRFGKKKKKKQILNYKKYVNKINQHNLKHLFFYFS